MKPVNITKKAWAVYKTTHQKYTVDDCLPQRRAIQSGKIGFNALTHGYYPGTRIKSELLPGVPSLGYFDVIGAQDWGIPLHRNEGIEICYQQTGESILNVDGGFHRMKSGSVSLTRPWQSHSLGDPNLKAGRLFWIILDVGVRRPNQEWKFPSWCIMTRPDQKELIRKMRGNEYPVWKATSRMGEVFSKLAFMMDSDSPESQLSHIRVCLNEVLLELLEILRVQNTITDEALTTRRRVVQLFLAELEHNQDMLAYPWTLNSMSEYCEIKRTTFSGYCREITNTTPLEALNRWRLAHAAQRLQDEAQTTITQIALESGYSTSQYFASKFKQQYGMSAREWRRKGACS